MTTTDIDGLVMRLDNLRDYVRGLDSGSGDAVLYEQAARALEAMKAENEFIKGTLAMAAMHARGEPAQVESLSHPSPVPDGWQQERERLWSAGQRLVAMSEGILSDLSSAHSARANVASEWMREDDRDQRRDFREIVSTFRAALAASPPAPSQPSPPVGWQDREPDGYSTDDEGGLLEDLLDEHDHGAITELTPYWCGERQWAVVHYDEDGLADHRLFDSEDEAKKFRDSSSAAALSEGGE